MRALVTGSTGFIGSHICKALLNQGYQVRAFHRPTSPQILINKLPIEHAIGDITEPETIKEALQGVDLIFHTAAQLGLPKHPMDMYYVTVNGTRNLLKAAMESKVIRIVHTSSVAALGVPLESIGMTPEQAFSIQMDENHTWNFPPKWWRYGHSKYLAEIEVQKAVAQGLDVVIVNPAIVIGDGDLHKVGGGTLIHAANRKPLVYLPGGLNAIHIEDVVQGHLAALEKGRTGERYILAGENLTIKQFVTTIAEVTQRKPPKYKIPANPLHLFASLTSTLHPWLQMPFSPDLLRHAGYYFFYSNNKVAQELKCISRRSIKTALQDALLWYRENNYIKSQNI